MKFLRIASLAVMGTMSVVSLHAQTVDEIINKHIDALGGKEKISAIKSVYTEYDMDVSGNQASGVTYVINGKAYKNEVDFGGQKIIQCITDKGSWGQNPMAGQAAPTAIPDEQAKMMRGSMDVGGPLFNYAAKGNTVELVGKDSLNGAGFYKLKVKTKEGNDILVWIDPATYYITKVSSKSNMGGMEGETTFVFSNYQKTDYGFVVPGNTELTMPQGFVLNITSKKVEVNKNIDMSIFDMPK